MKHIILAGTDPTPGRIELDNRKLAREAAAEGFVLLKNDGTLPLKNKKVALYGSGARMTVKGGTGSGAVRERYSVSIEEGLINAGIEISTGSWLDRFDKFYADTYETYRQGVEEKVKGITDFHKILRLAGRFEYPTGVPITDEDIAADKEKGVNTAIYVLARQAGEGADREDKKGDYRLDDVEIDNLRAASKGYENFIVVINAGGIIDVSFLDDIHVSALVYFVQGGEEGGNALGDVLSGKRNFSGKLATTWAYRFEDIPSNTTYSYLGTDEYNQEYNEGIYVGYRYFDTFGVKPRFPFGFGLSYTNFDIRLSSIAQEGNTFTTVVKVTNTGDISGKEVVQLYASVPFGRAGAESKRLVAFAKTDELTPGEEISVNISFDAKDISKYDEERSAFILEKGSYYIYTGDSSEVADPGAVIDLDDTVVLEQCTAVCRPLHDIEEIIPPARNDKKPHEGAIHIKLDRNQLQTIEHFYDSLPVYDESEITSGVYGIVEDLSDEELSTLVCGGGTSNQELIVDAMGASGTTTPDLFEKRGIPNVILSDGPAGLNLTMHVVRMEDGSLKAGLTPENLKAYERYLFGIAGMGMKSRMAKPEDGTLHYQYATAWPCSQLLAQTFNTELLEQVGDGVGKEMEEYGITVWLAPGMNIHRNPLCGRTFEYYSEDPVVSGKMAAAIVRGVQSHPGKGMSIKHFVANNCELNRNESSSNISERALREMYLRGFEIAVKESDPMTVMASYNMVNGVYSTNNKDLLVKVLRNEWGFRGMVISDWDSMKADPGDNMKAKTGDVLKAHAAQCDLVMPGRKDQVDALTSALSVGLVERDDLKRSAARILTMISKNTVVKGI